MKHRKSVAMVDALVWLLLGVALFFMLFFLGKLTLGKGTAQASDLLSSSRDYDNDGIADFFDKCACAAGEEKYEGCTSEAEIKGAAAVEREAKCKDTIKKAYK